MEQLPPVNAWGKAFLIPSFAVTSYKNQSCASDPTFNVQGDIIRVVAAQSGTKLSNNGQPFGPTMNLGDYYTFPLPATSPPLHLTANRPIQVMQLMMGGQARRGSANSGRHGDPSMAGELV
jgi:hypothetical protein